MLREDIIENCYKDDIDLLCLIFLKQGRNEKKMSFGHK